MNSELPLGKVQEAGARRRTRSLHHVILPVAGPVHRVDVVNVHSPDMNVGLSFPMSRPSS